MIWLGFALLSLVVLTPVILTQWSPAFRGRRQAAVDFHRAQLSEVAEERRLGRLGEREHAEAQLEIERRLLAASTLADDTPAPAHRFSLRLAGLALVLPVAALALYLPAGNPLLPAAPLAPRIAAAEARLRQDQAMLTLLQAKIATLDPASEEAREGYVLLGKLRADLGDAAGAAEAWNRALAIRFDQKLAGLRDMAVALARKQAAAAADGEP